MKKVLLLALTFMAFGTALVAQPNVFDPADPIVQYPSVIPTTNWGNIQKWVVTNRNLGWNTESYKAYHFNGISFRLKFPKTYQHNVADGKSYPVMIYWHGAGEKGWIYDNEIHLLQGGEVFRDRVDNGQFDGFVLFPQNTGGSFGPGYYEPVIQVLDSLAKYCKLDVDRVMVNGASAGGLASFDITAGYPTRIAKATPAAGVSLGTLPYIDNFIHIPIWFATGALDVNPSLQMAQTMYDSLKNHGGDVKWTLYPDRGHFIWISHWFEPGYVEYMNDMHKANPLVFFGKNEFCPDEAVAAKMGISPGFVAYEWQVDHGSGFTNIPGATSNEYTATSFGTYRVRFKRTPTGNWSAWSPKPVVVAQKSTTITPPIAIKGLRSKVLPAPDGSTTVPLRLPPGYVAYEYWRLSTDSTIVGTDSIYNAAPGKYRARVREQFGCNAVFSPDFIVVPANGINKPDAARNLTAFSPTPASIQLDWSDNPNPAFNETNFEVYRRTTADGPYTLVAITGPDVLSYVDQNLNANTKYYYIVRAVNNTSASPNSNETSATTQADNTLPTAPGNLRALAVSRFSATIAWDPATDDAAVSKYDIYVNGVRLYTTDQTSFVIYELDSFQRYSFVVRAKDISGNVSPPSNQLNVVTKNQGLMYQYYEGLWFTLPDFDAIGAPIKTGMTPNFDLSVRNREDQFAIIWRGFITIPTTGNYTFETCSDDGSKVYLGIPYSHTATPLVSNDFPHAVICKTGSPILLTAGTYPIAITYMEVGSDQVMELYWQNDVGLARQQVPNSAFADAFTAPGTAPNAPTALNATGTAFDRISLGWTDNSSNETGFEVARSTTSGGVYTNIGTTAAGATSFIDSGRNASTTYWYKVRAINEAGESAFTPATSATTLPPPPAPGAPTSLVATVISNAQINLVWNDNSTTETSFELYRSTNDNTNFRLIATLPGGAGAQKNFSDAGLFANVRYYYKVLARGVGGPSAFSNEANGKTFNSIPAVSDIIDFTIRYEVPYVLQLTATDGDGDGLTFTSDNLPAFATLTSSVNGIAEITFNPNFGDQGGYVINIYVDDGNGGKDTTYLNMLVNDNFPPTLNPISNTSVDEGSVVDLNLVANDTENPSFLNWTFTGLPAFASFSHNGMGAGTLHIAPGYAASGVYIVKLMVDDGFGAWIARTFTITVNEKDPNERILVSIKNGTTAPAPWNNMGAQSITNLVNTAGATTTVGAAVANSWQFNLNDLGAQTGNNSGVYPDAVMKDAVHWGYFLGNNTVDNSTLTISGLNPARKYTLIFFGSSIYNLYPDNGTTTYQVGALSASVAVQNNTTNRAVLNDISPNGSGVITVQMIGDPHPDIGGWLNAFEIINQYDDGTLPVRATNLTGEFVEHTGTVLHWTDVAYNEMRYKVYRATSLGGPYTLLNAGANNANAVTYTDATAIPVTQYYYYVVASNTLGDSQPSDTISILTGNNSPSINGLDNMFVKTESTLNEPFTVTDNAGETVTVTATLLPPFVTLQSLGGTSYQLVADPGKEFVGVHSLTIQAKDDKGGTTTKTITVQVADKRTRSFYVNFGVEGNAGGTPWNDFLGFAFSGKQLLNLKDEAGTTTGVSIRIEDSWSNTFRTGFPTGNNSGVYRDSVLISGIVSDHTTARRITFRGLNPAKKYNVAFIGSSNNGVTGSATYSATGAVASTLNARYNSTRVAYLNGLTPDGSNNIEVSATKLPGDLAMYLNGIVLEEYTDTVPLMNPIHLFTEPKDKGSVELTWADRTNNENGYEIYRATSAGGPWTLVQTTGANVTSFTNTGLTANTKYWYRVRARNNTGPVFSEYSNTDATITPKTIILVNLTFIYPAGAPWNNTNVNPDAGKSFPDLKNDLQQSTGINMSITQHFNGQNDAGMQTVGGIFPADVMRSCYWLDRLQVGQFKLTGLNHSKRYRIGFFGSIGPGWDGNFNATYSIGSRTVYLNSYRNDSKVVYIGDVQPDDNGEVLLNVSSLAEAAYTFTSAIVIQAYDDATGGTVTNRAEIVENNADVVSRAMVREITEEQHPNIRIQAYPNPFTDNIKIDFNNSAANNKVSVDIVDLTGRLVFRKDAGRVAAGMNTLRLQVPDGSFSPGVYMVRLNINGQVVSTVKLVKARK